MISLIDLLLRIIPICLIDINHDQNMNEIFANGRQANKANKIK